MGSGTATGEADACASLLAAHFVGDADLVRVAEEDFEEAQGRRTGLGAGGGRGLSARRVSQLLNRVVAALRLPVRSATACGPGEAGDVLVECVRGPTIRIEIKAQLTLPDFTWIQSADWIREQTDFLGALLTDVTEAREQLSLDVADLVLRDYVKDAGWTLGDLWVADVAGITNRLTRRKVGVEKPRDLHPFLTAKYLVHITLEGLRLYRFSDIPKLVSALRGGLRYKLMPPAKASELRVRTRGDGQVPHHGGIHLTYFLGQRNRPVGGHHMHSPFFDGAPTVVAAPA